MLCDGLTYPTATCYFWFFIWAKKIVAGRQQGGAHVEGGGFAGELPRDEVAEGDALARAERDRAVVRDLRTAHASRC